MHQEQLIAADVFSRAYNNEEFLFIVSQSRHGGLAINKYVTEDSSTSPPPFTVLTTYAPHIGFCTLQVHRDLIFFPYGYDKIGVIGISHLKQSEEESSTLPPLLKTEYVKCMIMFLKLVSLTDGEEFLLYGTEEGTLKMSNVIRVVSDNGTEQVVLIPWQNNLNLNHKTTLGMPDRQQSDQTSDELISPLCSAFYPLVNKVVVGTNNAFMYPILLNHATKVLEFGDKIAVPTKGTGAMDVHPNGRLLVTGGWDGVIRIYKTGSLTFIHQLRYHSEQITSIVFFSPMADDLSKRYTILASSKDKQVTLWNPTEKINAACQE